MMTVAEVAEVICRWDGVKRGMDPDQMELRSTYAYKPSHVAYYASWMDEDYGFTSDYNLYVRVNLVSALEIAATPEDVEAMLELTGVANTWEALTPDGRFERC